MCDGGGCDGGECDGGKCDGGGCGCESVRVVVGVMVVCV